MTPFKFEQVNGWCAWCGSVVGVAVRMGVPDYDKEKDA